MFLWVQVLRGLAAAMVVCHHYVGSQLSRGQNASDWLVHYGASGTDIFFVISGFIMMYTQFASKDKFSAASFLIKRLIRIAPLYWILTILAFLLAQIFQSVNSSFSLLKFFSSIFFLPYSENTLSMSAEAYKAYVIPMSWTLTFEWYFYAVFALIMSFKKNMNLVVCSLTVWFGFGVYMGVLFQPSSLIFQVMTSPLVFEFLLGCFVATLYLRGVRINPSLLILIAVGSLITLSSSGYSSVYLRVAVWGLASFALVSSATLFVKKMDEEIMLIKLLAWLGDISYSLYLSHFFTVAFFVRIQKKLLIFQDGFSIQTLILFVLINLIVAWLCYQFIENPTRKLLSKWTAKKI